MARQHEVFVDASFSPAKKGATESAKPSGARGRSGWWWSTRKAGRWDWWTASGCSKRSAVWAPEG